MEQRRRDQFEFLAAGREQYALSSGCIDYVTNSVNYEWAIWMIDYPRHYQSANNGRTNRDITPEYYDFLQEFPPVNEKAIGVAHYRQFLDRTLGWEYQKGFAASERPPISKRYNLSGLELSEETRAQLDSLYEHRQPLGLSAKIDLPSLGLSEAVQTQLDSIYTADRGEWFSHRYNLAKEKLEGRVFYWFLAGELIKRFKRGRSDAFAAWAQRKWEEFQQSNPYPEYNEAVLVALAAALKLQPGQSAPAFTLDGLDGQPVSLSQFKGQVVLLDFWASWCVPCIGDLPKLRKIKKKTADWPVVFLNISLDADEAAWREAIDKHEVEGVHVRADGEVAKIYQVMGIPSYYLVDSQGLIVEHPGVGNTDEIVATIEESL